MVLQALTLWTLGSGSLGSLYVLKILLDGESLYLYMSTHPVVRYDGQLRSNCSHGLQSGRVSSLTQELKYCVVPVRTIMAVMLRTTDGTKKHVVILLVSHRINDT